MPILAGWLTGEQVSQEIIAQTLTSMGEVLSRHGGTVARMIQPGMGLITFSDTAYAMQHNDEPPALDWSPDRRTLVYRRPLSGTHALYYIENWPAEGNLLFASEIKALLAVGVPRRLHLASLDALLQYGFIPAPWTAFKDIQIVPAGSILRWQRAKTVLNHATDYHLTETDKSLHTPEQLHSLLRQASAGQLPDHDHLVALLNGEEAASMASLLAAQQSTTPFTIASLNSRKSIHHKSWQEAERIATACKRPFLAITGVDQPEYWATTLASLEAPCMDTRPVALHQLLHTVAIETGARVAISGLGANVLLGKMTSTPPEGTGSEIEDVLAQYRQLLGRQTDKKKISLWSEDAKQALQDAEPWTATLHARKLARRAGQFSTRQQGNYYLDLHLRLPDSIVHTVQQLATEEQLVVRSPYLSVSVMEHLTALANVLEDGTAKEAALSTLLESYLPGRNQRTEPLSLTVPARSLLQSTNAEMVRELLSPEALKASGIFEPQIVEKRLKQPRGRAVSPELLLIFTTQLLYKLFNIEGWQ